MRRQFRSVAMAAAMAAAVVCMATGAAAQQSGGTPQGAGARGQGRPATSSSPSSADKSTLSTADAKFVKEAAEGGRAEVELGRLAVSRGSSPDVKQFGQRMVDDHSKANMELMDLARRKNVTVPTELAGKHKSEHDRLSKLSGAEFDRAYLRLMVDDHRKDVSEFKKQASAGKDPDVRGFASQTLPTLQQHLTTVEELVGHQATATSGRSTGSPQPKGSTGSGTKR